MGRGQDLGSRVHHAVDLRIRDGNREKFYEEKAVKDPQQSDWGMDGRYDPVGLESGLERARVRDVNGRCCWRGGG